MNFTLNQLQVFLKITQLKSITKASEELHLSQPAVSIQLKNFQNQFDIPLVEIVNKRVSITDFGNEIAKLATNILEEVETINNSVYSFRKELMGRLKISVVSTGKYVMPFFLSDFLKTHNKIQLELDVTNKAKVIESLEENEVDFSLVSVLPDKLNLNKIELMPNKLFLVGKNQYSSKSEKNSKSILNKIDLIFREQGSGTRYVMENYIEKKNILLRKKMELNTNEAVKQAVIAGLGYSIMPIIGIKNELINNDLQIVPVNGFPIQSTWSLIWLKNKKLSPVAEAYLEFIKSEKERIIKDEFCWYEKY